MDGNAEVKKLSNDIVKLLRQHDDMAVVSAALVLVLAAWLVKTGDDKDDAEAVALLSAQALLIAPSLRAQVNNAPDAEAISKATDEALTKLAEEASARRVESLPTRPVKSGKSPWGEVR